MIPIIFQTRIANVLTVPDFAEAGSNEALRALKTKCDASRTLGIVPVPNGELLCVYDGMHFI
jgi:hypothetical protein